MRPGVGFNSPGPFRSPSMLKRFGLWVLFAAVAAPVALAAPTSGPPVGQAPPSLKVYDATGPHKEMELDYVADAKGKPRVFVLIRAFDRPVARFLKVLDTALHEENAETLVVAVWLTDD